MRRKPGSTTILQASILSVTVGAGCPSTSPAEAELPPRAALVASDRFELDAELARQLAQSLSKQLNHNTAQGWPEAVAIRDGLLPVLVPGDGHFNKTRTHLDLPGFAQRVIQELSRRGCVAVLAPGEDTGGRAPLELRIEASSSATGTGGRTREDYDVLAQLVVPGRGIGFSTRVRRVTIH